MDKLALHPVTRVQLAAYLATPGHALCLIGPPGAGKGHTARTLAEQLLGNKHQDPIQHLGRDGAVGIDAIRGLQHFLRLKVPGTAPVRRAIIIENAHLMGDEAQNALLKTLEEPPADTVLLLTADGSSGLRSTIKSRVQTVRLLPLSVDEARSHFGQDIMKAYHLSGGYAGLLHSLLHDKDHHLVSAVEQAKTILKASPYERLLQVDGLAKQKERLPDLFFALQRVAGALLTTTDDVVKLRRLSGSLKAIYQAEQDIARSANTKLLLSDLFLQL